MSGPGAAGSERADVGPRRIALLVNPTAGRGAGSRAAREVAAGLRVDGARVHTVQGESVAAAASELAKLVAAGVDAVVALGGDGTVNLALQAVVNTPASLGIIPVGSGNDGARELGIPRGDLATAISVIRAGHRRRVDTGYVRPRQGEARYFLNVLSTGFDSSVNERANRMSWPHGNAKYVRAVLAELVTFRPVPYRVSIDRQERLGRAMLVSVGNTRSYGGGMLVCPTADPTDGVLDLIWLGEIGKLDFLRTFPRVFRGTHLSHPAVAVLTGRKFQINAPGQVAYADGERVGPLPVQVEVVPASAAVFLPT